MRRKITRNINKYLPIHEYELEKNIMKTFMRDLNKSHNHLCYIASEKIQKLSKKRYTSHQKRLCLITGRSRSVYKFFQLSRMQIKRLASIRFLTGLRSSSW